MIVSGKTNMPAKFTPEFVRHLMDLNTPFGQNEPETTLPWRYYAANRKMINQNFHVEFETGDNPGSLVRIMEKQPITTI